MPLQCPHCGIAQAEGDGICINCGQPLRSAPAAPLIASAVAPAAPAVSPDDAALKTDPPVQERRSSWKLPVLVALLLALAASALFIARRGLAPHSVPITAALPVPAPRPPAAVPPAPSAGPPLPVAALPILPPAAGMKAAAEAAASAAPLTITLASTRDGRHVKAGEEVTLTAFISSAHAQGATLTLFSRHGRGPKTIVSFVQGSLCSTIWMSPAPGRYEFTATALDHSQHAVSRRVAVIVDAPATPLTAARKESPSPVAAAPPRSARAPRIAPPRAVARVRPPASATSYHVAAARFHFSRSAIVLADALNQRGYHALPERMNDPQGKTVYAVVTGTYRRPKEARAAALILQRSGYPAYVFGGR